MLYDLPNELLKHILGYLKSDGQSVIQLSECSSRLYSLLMKSCPPPQIWEQLVQHRWVHRNNTGDDGVIADYRLEYKRSFSSLFFYISHLHRNPFKNAPGIMSSSSVNGRQRQEDGLGPPILPSSCM